MQSNRLAKFKVNERIVDDAESSNRFLIVSKFYTTDSSFFHDEVFILLYVEKLFDFMFEIF